jgi:hypothetical protein
MPDPRISRAVRRGRRKPNLRRKIDHLAYIRQLPCTVCWTSTPELREPAHVRCGTDGGMGLKPSDRYTVPLCAKCHAKQHTVGELTFWSGLFIDPLDVAHALYTISGDIAAGERIIFRAGQRIAMRRQGG